MADPFSTFLNTSQAIRQQNVQQGAQQNISGPGQGAVGYTAERRDALVELLHHLSDQAEAHAAELSDPAAVQDVIAQATAQAEQESPNFTLLRALLEALRVSVAPVSAMVAVTSALQALLADLRG
ncbi:hypothetical protein [Streptomyces sp. CC219B]|uniref:hypothetical protein n=1 Tax=Streptomyces sp. CC219B TaxID=3044574 RepID=UPI0024A82C21|nr:hypothetical protein [Streptomyces sp. CC219B]